MRETKEVQKVLNYYVKHNLPQELGITPLSTDRAFYPMPRDIKNHIGNAKSLLELSKLDQENLHLKIEEWKKVSTTKHYLRLYIRQTKHDLPHAVCNITAGHWPFSDHFCSSAEQFQLWLAILSEQIREVTFIEILNDHPN